MPQNLLIIDANVFIDMEVGGLLETMFEIDYEIAVPDILFEEELRAHHPELLDHGLQSRELSAESILYVSDIAERYRDRTVSRNDLFTLALARQENCSLLTGDNDLRRICEVEGIMVHGTVWLMEQLLNAGAIDYQATQHAYEAMREAARRLPWNLVDEQLARFRE